MNKTLLILMLCTLISVSGCRASDKKLKMIDNNQIEQAYRDMYVSMVSKDAAGLNRVLAETFTLVHMTGMQQSKAAFIDAVVTGILNYYTCEHEQIVVDRHETETTLVGLTRVEAAVFGGGKHTWRLRQYLKLKQIEGHWLITRAEVSTY